MSVKMSVAELVERGVSACRRGQHEPGRRFLEAAAEKLGDPSRLPPRALACFGYALAAGDRRQIPDAVRLCQAAVGRELAAAGDVYLALARIYELAGSRKLMLRALEDGIRAEPDNDALVGMRARVGVRQAPFFPFLARTNPLNRAAGRLRHRLRQRGKAARPPVPRARRAG